MAIGPQRPVKGGGSVTDPRLDTFLAEMPVNELFYKNSSNQMEGSGFVVPSMKIPSVLMGTDSSSNFKPFTFSPLAQQIIASNSEQMIRGMLGIEIPENVSELTNDAGYITLSQVPSPPAQVQTDWNAVSGLGVLLNKPSTFTPAAHTQAWSTITATPTTVSGYGITDAVSQSALSTSLAGYATTTALTNGLSTKFNTPVGTTTQYLRGDGSLATFPAIPTVPTAVSAFTNDAGYLTNISSSQVSTALGYTPYNGTTNPNSYITQSGARTSVSLTTTGTTGAATYNSTTGVLNVPNYSAPVRTFTNPARTLNTAFQISSTQDAQVSYSVDITVAAVLIAGTSGRVYLEYANEIGFTTGVTVVGSSGQSTGGVLSITNLGTANLSGIIPAGKYVRLRTVNVTGTPTFTFQSSQEVLL
jgi:hypothetical protein